MLLVCFLVVCLVVLLVFSMSREKGKNTKYARKGANAIDQNQEISEPIDTSEVVEIN